MNDAAVILEGSNPSFSGYDWCTGFITPCDPNFPTDLSAWDDGILHLDPGKSHYGFVQQGPCSLVTPGGIFPLNKGMYFSLKGDYTARIMGPGRGIVMSRHDHMCFFHIGGPVERGGRLKYIDGCTDSLLIPPIKMGDPCLNLLYFPEGIDQTEHTHPSDRVGLVYAGEGECVTPYGVMKLVPGMIFCIHANGPHKFRTLSGSDMTVIAYHPDSDFGPTDQYHPMINRTIVNGVSASELDDIRTK